MSVDVMHGKSRLEGTVNERWRLERLRFARNSLFRILVNVERDIRLEAIRAAD